MLRHLNITKDDINIYIFIFKDVKGNFLPYFTGIFIIFYLYVQEMTLVMKIYMCKKDMCDYLDFLCFYGLMCALNNNFWIINEFFRSLVFCIISQNLL